MDFWMHWLPQLRRAAACMLLLWLCVIGASGIAPFVQHPAAKQYAPSSEHHPAAHTTNHHSQENRAHLEQHHALKCSLCLPLIAPPPLPKIAPATIYSAPHVTRKGTRWIPFLSTAWPQSRGPP